MFAINLLNALILVAHFSGAVALYGILYGHISYYEIYPYKRMPLISSVLLAMFIGPGLFVLFQISESGYNDMKWKFVPDLKFKREMVQFLDTDQLHNIWNCGTNSKIGSGIATLLYRKIDRIYRT